MERDLEVESLPSCGYIGVRCLGNEVFVLANYELGASREWLQQGEASSNEAICLPLSVKLEHCEIFTFAMTRLYMTELPVGEVEL